MTRRRELPVSELRVTTNGIQVLKRMRDLKVDIYYDDEVCVLLTTPNRKLSHKVIKSLRSMRFIRNRDDDPAHYVLTHRALDLLDMDSRTRPKRDPLLDTDAPVAPKLWIFNTKERTQ